MTPCERIAYEQACEEQGADMARRGINSAEDFDRARAEERRAGLIARAERIMATIAEAKEIGR